MSYRDLVTILKHLPGEHDQSSHAGSNRGVGGTGFKAGDNASLRSAVKEAGWDVDEVASNKPGKMVHTKFARVDMPDGATKAVRMRFINLPSEASATIEVGDVGKDRSITNIKSRTDKSVDGVYSKKDVVNWVKNGRWDKPPEEHPSEGEDAYVMRALYGSLGTPRPPGNS